MVLSSAIVCDRDRRIADDRRSSFHMIADDRTPYCDLRSAIRDHMETSLYRLNRRITTYLIRRSAILAGKGYRRESVVTSLKNTSPVVHERRARDFTQKTSSGFKILLIKTQKKKKKAKENDLRKRWQYSVNYNATLYTSADTML